MIVRMFPEFGLHATNRGRGTYSSLKFLRILVNDSSVRLKIRPFHRGGWQDDKGQSSRSGAAADKLPAALNKVPMVEMLACTRDGLPSGRAVHSSWAYL
jgi:hypothetical protein